jgi:hypothetical protein
VLTGALAILWLIAGCGDTSPEAPPAPVYPLDDVLRMTDAQSVGTHNSYHLDSLEGAIPPWDYSHAPLDVQLGELGVRQFELDTYWRRVPDSDEGRFEVLHVPVVDASSTCPTFRDCVSVQKAWSDAHPDHLPFLTLIETKSGGDSDSEADLLVAELTEELAAVWPKERLVTPDLLEAGWPLLSVARGRAVYVLHSGGRPRQALLRMPLEAMLLVPDDAPAAPGYAQFHSSNDPLGGGAAHIAELVRAGHLVRTRADVDGENARANDTTRLEAALQSGAHYVSTDFPAPHPDTGYVVEMPGGTPSRCTPVVAPEGCTSESLEAP